MYGLVLEGGGAKGSYHMGVYKAILEEEIEISAIAGTSIGALNGAMIAQGDFELGLRLWNEISYTDVIEANEMEIKQLLNSKLNLEDLKLIGRKIISVITEKGFDITPFKKLLNDSIDEEKIRNSPIDFGMVAVNLTDFIPIKVFVEDIPQGKLTEFLLASAYLPIFKFERLGGKIYLDGGFYDNLPYKLLQQKGYEDLIIVRTHAKGIVRKPESKKDMIIISPSRDIGRSYRYEKEKAKDNINMGYYDALKVFRGLKGNLYYIEAEDEEYYIKYLCELSENKIKKIFNKLDITEKPTKRSFFEYCIPKLGIFMGLEGDFTYEDFVISLLEKKAKELEVIEYKIYTFEDLLAIIKTMKPIEKNGKAEINTIEKALQKVDLAKYFNKDVIILEIANVIFIENQ